MKYRESVQIARAAKAKAMATADVPAMLQRAHERLERNQRARRNGERVDVEEELTLRAEIAGIRAAMPKR